MPRQVAYQSVLVLFHWFKHFILKKRIVLVNVDDKPQLEQESVNILKDGILVLLI